MPTKLIGTSYDFQSVNSILGLPQATAAGQPVVYEQLDAILSGLSWKDNVKVYCLSNVNLASPGATLDGQTMSPGFRVALGGNTTQSENGIYVWSGASTPLTRGIYEDTADGLLNAVFTVDLGTYAGTSWRQNNSSLAVLGTDPVTFTSYGGSPPASESTAGIAQIATLAETNTGTNDTKFITPLKLSTSNWIASTKKFTIGDATSTSFTLTHNFNTFDVSVEVVEATGNRRTVDAEIRRTSVNAVQVLYTPAPATNALVVYVQKQVVIP